MGDVAAVLGAVLLFAGVVLVALLGNRRSASWVSYIGIAFVVIGLGVEVAGAVSAAA